MIRDRQHWHSYFTRLCEQHCPRQFLLGSSNAFAATTSRKKKNRIFDNRNAHTLRWRLVRLRFQPCCRITALEPTHCWHYQLFFTVFSNEFWFLMSGFCSMSNDSVLRRRLVLKTMVWEGGGEREGRGVITAFCAPGFSTLKVVAQDKQVVNFINCSNRNKILVSCVDMPAHVNRSVRLLHKFYIIFSFAMFKHDSGLWLYAIEFDAHCKCTECSNETNERFTSATAVVQCVNKTSCCWNASHCQTCNTFACSEFVVFWCFFDNCDSCKTFVEMHWVSNNLFTCWTTLSTNF